MGIFGGKNPSISEDGTRYRALPVDTPRAITASAARIRLDNKTEVEGIKARKSADRWQDECWEYYDAIGEIKYSAFIIGAALSRMRIYAAASQQADQAPAAVQDVPDLPVGMADDAQKALARLESANGGLPGLFTRAGLNIWVAGECYLVQTPARPTMDLPEQWDIKSIDELVVGNRGQLSLKSNRTARAGAGLIDLPSTAFAGRIWRAHARYSDEADSSLKAVRDECDELLLLGRMSRATARSRLNAGAMYLPDGLSVAATAEEESELDDNGDLIGTDAEHDEFEDELINSMTAPILDEESASAVVPLIIRGPAELADKIKLFKFERSFDPALAQRADTCLTRILHGIDVPKDTVTGVGHVRYSNAVQIDESLFKAHVEPLVILICDALTAVYLRPSLIAMGYTPREAARAVIWYDPSEILTKPDRAQSANDGLDRHALSSDAWRRAHGYSDADAPSDDELVLRALIERAQFTPDLASALFKVMAPQLFQEVRAQNIADSPAPLPTDVQQMLNPGQEPVQPSGQGGDQAPSSSTPAPSSSAPSSAPQSDTVVPYP